MALEENTAGAAEGSSVIALTTRTTGICVSVNGGEATLLAPSGPDAKALGKLLDRHFTEPKARVLLIGTRSDGTPGWDGIDLAELETATRHRVTALSEAQALHRGHGEGRAAYIILAPAIREGGNERNRIDNIGTARWWVQDNDGTVNLVNADFAETTGEIYTLGGGSLTGSPTLLASMVGDLVKAHPDVKYIYLWSQDGGLNGNDNYKPGGLFWRTLWLPDNFTEGDGEVTIVPLVTDVMRIASRQRPQAEKPITTPNDDA